MPKIAFILLIACLAALPLRSGEQPAREAAINGFIDQVNTHFPAWDQNKNGQLSLAELDAAGGSAKIVGGEAAAIAALKRALNNAKLPAPTLTLENIVKLSKAPPPPLEGPNFPKMYAEGLAKIGKANRAVFVSEVPQMAALHQGRLGDCFCLAPLGAMLHRDPKQVADMFALQPDGKCSVKLGKKTVTVEMPTDTELAMSASARSDGIWVNLYEKAAGVARNESRPEKDRTDSPIDALAHGGSAGTMLALITGHEIARFSCKYFKDDKLTNEAKAAKLQALREQLSAAAKEKRLMTCGTQVTTTPGITPNHAYAVLDFDEKSDTLKLWNPHGTNFTPKESPGKSAGYPRKDGIFAIPLTDFVLEFAGLAFEQVPKSLIE